MTSPQYSEEDLARWEARAPGWRGRCLKCGFMEPWGKHGIRVGARGTKYTVKFCSACRRFRFHAIEKAASAR